MERGTGTKLYVFDAPELDKPFEDRYKHLELSVGNHPTLKLITATRCTGVSQLIAYISNHKGHEGIILRKFGSQYSEKDSILHVFGRQMIKGYVAEVDSAQRIAKCVLYVFRLRMKVTFLSLSGEERRVIFTDQNIKIGDVISFSFDRQPSLVTVPIEPQSIQVENQTWEELCEDTSSYGYLISKGSSNRATCRSCKRTLASGIY